MHKADSAAAACREINPNLRVARYREPLSPQNAEDVCGAFDVVIDCSDNAPTRYLVNDACVVTGVPLVAGAAVGTEGQLTVYNHAGGPCYRCALVRLTGMHACRCQKQQLCPRKHSFRVVDHACMPWTVCRALT